MAVRKRRPNRTYGLDNALQEIAPRSINSNRAPSTSDLAEIGQQWVDMPNDAVYVLTSITANSANWATSPASGSETLSSLTVTGTTNLQGAVTLDSTLDVTGDTTVANLDVTGTLNFTGDLDLTSAALIDLTSTLNAAPSIYLHANGGTSEQILLRSDQGTAVDSVSLLSDVGGITLQSTGFASDDAINLNANAGGVDINAALQLNMSSSENAADAVVIASTAGGIDILATGEAGQDIDIVNTGGSVNISATEDVASAITIVTNGGTSETLVLTNTQGTSASAIDINSTAGGIDADAAGNITLDSSAGAISLDAAAASNFSVSGAGVDIDIVSAGGRLILTAGEDAADAIYLHADAGTSEKIRIHSDQGTAVDSVELESDVGGITLLSGLASADAINITATAGGVDVDGALQVNIASSQAAADAVRINASNASGGIDIDDAGGGITVDSAAGISLDAAAASNFSVSGAGIDINIASAAGRLIMTAGEDAADAIYLHADAGTSEKIRLHSDQGTAADSVELESDVGGITLLSGLASTDAINLTATNGGVDIDGALEVNISSSEASVADAVTISASHAAGGITLDAGVTPGVTFTNGTQSFQVLTGSGSPNGSVTASQGSLYVDIAGTTSTTILFVNTDGSTTWVGVGA